jgi:hypothetical protein
MNFQCIEKLNQMGDLGDMKQSDLLANMLELCPHGHEANELFLFLFLQRLPAKLCVLLRDDENADPRDLATKGDRLWAMHAHRQVRSVAAVKAVEEPSPVAAVHGGHRGHSGSCCRYCWSRGGNRPPRAALPQQPAANSLVPGQVSSQVTPAALGKLSSGPCHPHWTYDDSAFRCEPLAAWETNCPKVFNHIPEGRRHK